MYVYDIPRRFGSSVDVRKTSVSPRYLGMTRVSISSRPASAVACGVSQTHTMARRSNCLPCDCTVKFMIAVLLSARQAGGV